MVESSASTISGTIKSMNKKKIDLLALAVTVWSIPLTMWAQSGTPATELAMYQGKYPDDPAIFLDYREHMYLSVVNDSLKIKIDHYEEVLHLSENSKMYAQGKIYSSSFVRVSDVTAQTLVPGKKKYEPIPVTEFKESFDKDSYVFFDDVKYINFFFPALQPGAKTQLSYTETITDPHFLGSYRFKSYLPIQSSSLAITFDEGIDIDFQIYNDTDGTITKTEKASHGQRTITFSKKEIPKLKFEANAPPLNFEEAHIVPRIKSFINSENETISVLSSADDLFAWYSTFIRDLKKENDEVKNLLGQIISDDDSELEKVKKIFYWVQDNIKYIAFEQGMRGLIPHPGNYVLKNRYGDCKDMSSIIISLLYNAGIESKFVWIGTRDLPYKYSELPSPMVDNHMIAAYLSEGNYYFLDATGQYTPFGYPTSMIQGKEALVEINLENKKFEIAKVPELDPEKSIMADVYSYNISNGNVQGHGTLTLSGYAKTFNTYKMIKSDQKATDDYINRLLSRGNNKFFVDSYQLSNLDDRDRPIELNYTFRVEDYYRSVGNEIYFNMNLDKGLSGSVIKEDRVHKIENDYKYINSSESFLVIPDGYKVKLLPPNAGIDTDLFSYSISYEQVDDKVVQKKQYAVKYLLMEQGSFGEWNKAIKDFSDSIRQVVILTKKDS